MAQLKPDPTKSDSEVTFSSPMMHILPRKQMTIASIDVGVILSLKNKLPMIITKIGAKL